MSKKKVRYVYFIIYVAYHYDNFLQIAINIIMAIMSSLSTETQRGANHRIQVMACKLTCGVTITPMTYLEF